MLMFFGSMKRLLPLKNMHSTLVDIAHHHQVPSSLHLAQARLRLLVHVTELLR